MIPTRPPVFVPTSDHKSNKLSTDPTVGDNIASRPPLQLAAVPLSYIRGIEIEELMQGVYLGSCWGPSHTPPVVMALLPFGAIDEAIEDLRNGIVLAKLKLGAHYALGNCMCNGEIDSHCTHLDLMCVGAKALSSPTRHQSDCFCFLAAHRRHVDIFVTLQTNYAHYSTSFSLAIFSAILFAFSVLSSLSVTNTQNQADTSMKPNVNTKLLFRWAPALIL